MITIKGRKPVDDDYLFPIKVSNVEHCVCTKTNKTKNPKHVVGENALLCSDLTLHMRCYSRLGFWLAS